MHGHGAGVQAYRTQPPVIRLENDGRATIYNCHPDLDLVVAFEYFSCTYEILNKRAKSCKHDFAGCGGWGGLLKLPLTYSCMAIKVGIYVKKYILILSAGIVIKKSYIPYNT